MFAHRGRDQLTWNELMQQDYPASSAEPVCSRPVDAMTKLLSPAAQAVLDAFRTSHTGQGCLAAALRAAADQVVPNGPKPSANSDYHLNNWTKSMDQYYQRQQTREELLDIADELEANAQ